MLTKKADSFRVFRASGTYAFIAAEGEELDLPRGLKLELLKTCATHEEAAVAVATAELDRVDDLARSLWKKCAKAAVRVGALAILVVLHVGMDWLAIFVAKGEFKDLVWGLRLLFVGAFGWVYTHELWEMVAIFVPRARGPFRLEEN